jgi:hypothetical protein
MEGQNRLGNQLGNQLRAALVDAFGFDTGRP